jgi:hypothetical protein
MNSDVPGRADTASTYKDEQDAPLGKDETEDAEDDCGLTFANLLPQMMFVSGETAEPSSETTTLIEDITRQQVIEIVCTVFLYPVNYLLMDITAHTQHRPGYSSGLTVYLN